MPYWYNEIYTVYCDQLATRHTVSAIVDTCHCYDSLPADRIRKKKYTYSTRCLLRTDLN